MHLVFYKYKKKRRTFEALGTISNLILLTDFRDQITINWRYIQKTQLQNISK